MVWTPKWPGGCRMCGTKAKGHMGQGYCWVCYRRAIKMGKAQTNRNATRIRVRNGETQFYCYNCSNWKSQALFRVTGHKFRTRCRECTNSIRRKRYSLYQKGVYARRKVRDERVMSAMREADKTWKPRVDPWRRNKGVVPIELVRDWLERAYLLFREPAPGAVYTGWRRVATITGISERRIAVLRNDSTIINVSVDVAEKLASAIDVMDEFREVLPPHGVVGWSKRSQHCLRCGRCDVPHQALGLCYRCYHVTWYHRKHGREAPPPVYERWATFYSKCVICSSTKTKHQGHGLCKECYNEQRRKK
jgi:hypothetical protein